MENEREKYRAFYDNSPGIEILTDQAVECGFFENLETPEDMALFNYFRSQLEKIGIFDAGHINNGALIRKLMELPLIPEPTDGRENQGIGL